MVAMSREVFLKSSSLEVKRPLAIRLGEAVLLFLFVALLAGRFTLDRVLENAVGFDLRYLFLGFGIIAVSVWLTGARGQLPPKVPMAGSFPLLFWSLWMALSSAWAPYAAEVEKTIADFVFMVAFVLLSWLVMSFLPADSLDRVWKWMIITGIIYFILAMISGPDLQGRYAAPGGGPNTFVRVMVSASIAALYLALVKRKNLPLLTFPIFAIGAILSGSRGGLLAAVIVLVLFSIPIFKIFRSKRTLILLVSIIVFSVPAIKWNDNYLWHFVEERFIVQTFGEGYYSGRDVIAEQTLDMYLNNFVLGVGLDGFAAHQDGISVGYAHNLVLSVLAEAGTVGGIFLAILLLRLISSASHAGKESRVIFFLIIGLYYFLTTLFSGDYYDSRFVWFFLGLAGIASARSKVDKSCEVSKT